MRPRLIALFPNEKKASSIKIAKEICHFLKSQQFSFRNLRKLDNLGDFYSNMVTTLSNEIMIKTIKLKFI